MRQESEKMFQAVFENSPVGLVIVDKDTSLLEVNNYMFNIFKLKPMDIKGQRFGNVFNCSTISGGDKVCGETEKCKQCALRNYIMPALVDSLATSDRVVDHGFNIDGLNKKKWFKISVSPILSNFGNFAIVSFVDITTQKEYEELLSYQLSLDMATGITNKHALLKTLKSLILGKENLSLALIDFDNFKYINDSYGHIVGDKVLNLFCLAASANIRKKDILGRFGGEEFMLILPGASFELLIKVIKRISKVFQEDCSRELKIKPTFSAGVVEFSPKEMLELDTDEIVERADSNLYLSKSRGKNRITFNGESIIIE